AEKDPDGVTRIKFLVDADIFAVLGRNGDKRAPFVIKDGVVYMNKLLLDDAEIGSVIAKYINVQDLVAVKITASTIKSSDNGASFSLLPDGTMSCTKATIKGAVTATSGSFTGTVNANAGTFNNVTIAENCNVLGTVYAERIVGDVCKTMSTSENNATITIPSTPRTRKLVITGLIDYVISVDRYISEIGGSVLVQLYVNGSVVVSRTYGITIYLTARDFRVNLPPYEAFIPAGQNTSVKFVITVTRGGTTSHTFTISEPSPLIAMAFIQ
ncbi:MAG: phage tail tip fiber protein, partial [Shewanella sp.]